MRERDVAVFINANCDRRCILHTLSLDQHYIISNPLAKLFIINFLKVLKFENFVCILDSYVLCPDKKFFV